MMENSSEAVLAAFFNKSKMDKLMIISHVSLFAAIYHCSKGESNSKIPVTRRKLMQLSKICSIATYHKCMRDLNEEGYIIYKPSFNPKGSIVKII